MSEDDRKKTTPIPRRPQTQTERDIAGLAKVRSMRAKEKEEARNRAELRALERQRREDEDDDDIPDEIDEDGEPTGRTERIEQDPDLNRLFVGNQHTRTKIARTKREFADMLLEVAGEKPPEERFAKVEKGIKWAHWVLTVIAIPAISSTVLVVKYLVSKGREEERAIIERERDREQIQSNKKEIETLKGRFDRFDRRHGSGFDRDDTPDPPDTKAKPP